MNKNNRMTVEVNGVKVHIAKGKRDPSNKWDLPYLRLPDTDGWWYQDMTLLDLMKATNHYENVDAAIPQHWAEKWHRETGEWPRCVWSYEKAHIFGEPLWVKDMLKEFHPKLREAILEALRNG